MTTVRCWHLEQRHMLRFWLKHVASVLLSLKACVCLCVFVHTCFCGASLLSITATPMLSLSSHLKVTIWQECWEWRTSNNWKHYAWLWHTKEGRCVVGKSRRFEWISWAASVSWKLYWLLFSESCIKSFVLLILTEHIKSPVCLVANVYLHTRPTDFLGLAKLQ